MAFNRVLRATLGIWLRVHYRITTENQELIDGLKPPYLLLPNHASVMDPFMVNSRIPHPVHYVVSDASFRSRLVSFGLSLVGSIPKTKVMSDLETIKNIVRVKDRGGIIGIFPEGQSTWDGHSLPIYYSTAKLAKLLRVPVVTARVAGSFLSRPRWAKSDRRGRVSIRFDLAYTPEQLRQTPVEEIDRRIAEMLTHDEYDYNRVARVKFHGTNRAEYVERVLFVCPSCVHVGTLRSEGNELTCTNCGYQVHYGLMGFFRRGRGELRFETIRDWNLWQRAEFERQLRAYLAVPQTQPFLREAGVRTQIGYKSFPLAPFHTGTLELFADRIVLHPRTGEREEFPIAGVQGANVQNNEHWEFYEEADLFRITFLDPRGCTYKWDFAVHLMQEMLDSAVDEALQSE